MRHTPLVFDFCLRWEQEAHSRAETFTPILGLMLATLLYGQFHLRTVHQTSLQILSERLAHCDKGFVEVWKSMCRGFRRRHSCRAASHGHADRTLRNTSGLLHNSAVSILQ